MAEAFGVALDPAIDILFADYDAKNYDGYALVVFAKDGQLYEVDGSHCSCYGLEGQWQPEATTLTFLTRYLENTDKQFLPWMGSGLDSDWSEAAREQRMALDGFRRLLASLSAQQMTADERAALFEDIWNRLQADHSGRPVSPYLTKDAILADVKGALRLALAYEADWSVDHGK